MEQVRDPNAAPCAFGDAIQTGVPFCASRLPAVPVLFSSSRDKSLQAVDTMTGKVVIKNAAAHDAPINAMLRVTEALLMTGDDNGVIKVRDGGGCQ